MTTVRVRFTPNGTPTPGQISFVARHDEDNRPIVSGRDILDGNPEWVSVPVEGADVEVRPNDPGWHYVVRAQADGHPRKTATFTIPPNGPINLGDLVRYDPKAGMAYEPDPDWYAHLSAVENGINGVQAELTQAVTTVQGIATTTADSIRGEVSAEADRAETSANQASGIKEDLEQIFLGGTETVNNEAVRAYVENDGPTRSAVLTTGSRIAGTRSGLNVQNPNFVRQNDDLVTQAQSGLPSLYWPWIVYAGHIPGALGNWYLYYSTDHAGTNDGMGMAYANNIAGPYTVHSDSGTPVVWKDTTAGTETETPAVIWNEDTELFHIYYQQAGVGASQSTLLMTSPSGLLNDPANELVANVFPGNERRMGDGHNGYARVSRIGGKWVAYHLSGGGNFGTSVVSFSNDGIYWVDDPRRLQNSADLSDLNYKSGVGGSSLFTWRGEVWGLAKHGAYASGNQPGLDDQWIVGRVSEDLRRWRDRWSRTATSIPAGETTSTVATCVIEHEGKLYAFYRSDGQQGALRVAIAEA